MTATTRDRGSLLIRVGFGVWVGLALLTATGTGPLTLLEVVFLLAPLVVVPLGRAVLRRFEPQLVIGARGSVLLQFAGALLVAASFWLPQGMPSAALVCGWLLFCCADAFHALWFFFRQPRFATAAICFLVATLYLSVGAVWLVLSRAGATPMSFAEPIVLLTAVHFHYAGFATAVLAGSLVRTLALRRPRSWVHGVVWMVLAGPALLALGFVLSDTLRFVFALWMVVSLWALAGATLWAVKWIQPRKARVLLTASAGTVFLGMVLVVVYATGEYLGEYWLLIPQMARWHGVVNGIGFALLGLLGWNCADQPL